MAKARPLSYTQVTDLDTLVPPRSLGHINEVSALKIAFTALFQDGYIRKAQRVVALGSRTWVGLRRFKQL